MAVNGDPNEDLIVELEVDRENASVVTRFGLIGKIIFDRILNKKGVNNVLKSIWPERVLLRICDLGPNLYGFAFVDRKSMEYALSNGPWTVMGHCLCLKRWDSALAVNEIRFEEVAFWVQVHNLPLEVMTTNNAHKIGAKLGKIIEVENPDWVKGFGRGFLRLRVAIDPKKSLIGRFKMPRYEGDSITAEVRYEKLGDFCYKCGMLGHSERACLKPGEGDNVGPDKAKYGAWMRAIPIRGGKREQVAEEKENPVQEEREERGVPELIAEDVEPVNQGNQTPPNSNQLFFERRGVGIRRHIDKGKATATDLPDEQIGTRELSTEELLYWFSRRRNHSYTSKLSTLSPNSPTSFKTPVES
ncbi:hypothetical protein COLO4_12194 [Corchorus olitorius]|uniref:CCHC-type domain-containing protein n=1 Tax=Corchorus olitorius TaxID=93759 RepID=A0A1R3K223_9ROSI|nr:hypothetical protein COLO4_12194 [Corchorus olitorius]